MFTFYGFILSSLRQLGLKKTAVKLAYFMENLDNSDMFDAAQLYLYGSRSGFTQCSECFLPILSDTEDIHKLCRDEIQRQIDEEERAWVEYEAQLAAEGAAYYAKLEQRAADQQHLDDLMDSFCTEQGCYEEGHRWDNRCLAHEYCGGCDSYPCECGSRVNSYSSQDDDECEGGCGQPSYACTCAELASLARHNADPATRGSWWVA